MSEQSVTGLSCPRCGGMVQIPEGQAIVVCPYCDLRSSVSSGEASLPVVTAAAPGEIAKALPVNRHAGVGVRRYQAPLRVKREAAMEAYQRFLTGHMSVARDAARAAKITEVFLVHLPFWAAWGRGVAYAFGQQKVGSGDNERYEPREKKVVREMSWNMPACEVGEFGVRQVGLRDCQLEPFNPDQLHRTGMVFEPVGSAEEALETARKTFEDEVRSAAKLSRVAQLFTRILRPRMGVVYYPMWVVRYTYHGRIFQVVVDGYDGQVLYGKAPGSIFYRTGALIGGMAVGAVVAIDVPVLLLSVSSGNSDNSGLFWAALVAFIAGLGIMWGGFRTYRYGEHYEYQRFKADREGKGSAIKLLGQIPSDSSELLDTISKITNLEGR